MGSIKRELCHNPTRTCESERVINSTLYIQSKRLRSMALCAMAYHIMIGASMCS